MQYMRIHLSYIHACKRPVNPVEKCCGLTPDSNYEQHSHVLCRLPGRMGKQNRKR